MREVPFLQTIHFAELSRLSQELDAEKPYFELIEGLEVQKVSPQTRHSRLQGKLFTILDAWANERGIAGTEWRFWLIPTAQRRTSLVPDVAYVSRRRFAALGEDQREMPPFAPDIAVEIRSPGERRRNLQRKVELYLAHGSNLVLDVDPKTRTIVAHDGAASRTFTEHERFEHPAAPGLSIDVRKLFASVEEPRRPVS
jgi:Uma2 family endonuclease